MKRYVILTICFLSLCVDCFAARNKRNKEFSMGFRQVYIAPKLGIAVPLGLGRKDDEIAFNDVAANGFSTGIEALWMQNPQIGIGGELGYMANPFKEQYWGNLATRGTFDASYKAFSLMALGRVFIGERRIKPVFGVAAGAYLIKNKLDFESKWKGTDNDESVFYTTSLVNIAYAAETGLLYKVGSKTFVSISVRLNFIPRLKEEYQISVDPYTFEERRIALNPQGNENNIEFKLGFYFGVRDRIKK